MKQINKTPEITAALRQSVGKDVNLDNLAVYEAIALNNRPLRKNHPLYQGAIADRSLLLEMAGALSVESRPVQIEHGDDNLPTGRAFHGKVVDKGTETELRVLFFVDTTEDKVVSKLDSGTIDQVSVSVMPKKLLNSKSGFDYLGPQATAENIWTGDDGEGNVLGKNGVHARMVGLGQWFELSLVGMGGAENARIVSRDESFFGSSYAQLAASGVDPSVLVLEASTESEDMDLKELIDKIASTTADLTTRTAEVATLTAANTTLTARVAELDAAAAAAAKPDEALTAAQADLTETKTKLTAAEADLNAALSILQDVATKLLAAIGKVGEKAPESITDIKKLIDDNSKALAAALANGDKSQDASADKTTTAAIDLSAYRRTARR